MQRLEIGEYLCVRKEERGKRKESRALKGGEKLNYRVCHNRVYKKFTSWVMRTLRRDVIGTVVLLRIWYLTYDPLDQGTTDFLYSISFVPNPTCPCITLLLLLEFLKPSSAFLYSLHNSQPTRKWLPSPSFWNSFSH